MKYRVIYVVLIPLLVSACAANDGECRKEKIVTVGVSNYKTVYNSTSEEFVSSALTERFTIYGLDEDSLLYDTKSLSSYELPLHTLQNRSSFVLQRDTLGADTLTIIHQNNPQFISLECGCFVYYTIQDVVYTVHQIDSVVITNTYVQNVAENHLKIYYRVTP